MVRKIKPFISISLFPALALVGCFRFGYCLLILFTCFSVSPFCMDFPLFCSLQMCSTLIRERVLRPLLLTVIVFCPLWQRLFLITYAYLPPPLSTVQLIEDGKKAFRLSLPNFQIAAFLRFDKLVRLLRSDVVIENEMIQLFLESSKTCQYRDGAWVLLALSGNATCPVPVARCFVSCQKPNFAIIL